MGSHGCHYGPILDNIGSYRPSLSYHWPYAHILGHVNSWPSWFTFYSWSRLSAVAVGTIWERPQPRAANVVTTWECPPPAAGNIRTLWTWPPTCCKSLQYLTNPAKSFENLSGCKILQTNFKLAKCYNVKRHITQPRRLLRKWMTPKVSPCQISCKP